MSLILLFTIIICISLFIKQSHHVCFIQKKLLVSSILLLFFSFPAINSAVTNTDDYLILDPGETIELTGTIHKKVSIVVAATAEITITPYDGSGINNGELNLIAPFIQIDGTIQGDSCAYNTEGSGGAPTGEDNGGGGAGHGGLGGDGKAAKSGSYGEGGPSYGSSTYTADLGSYGWRANYKEAYSGYGGAIIRLDAIDFIVGSSGRLYARGNPDKVKTVGGGSGGCVFINSNTITLASGSVFSVNGGPGGGKEGAVGEAGGGAGGRIKVWRRTTLTNNGVSLKRDGGDDGGGSATAGEDGSAQSFLAMPPSSPMLISPTDGATVGVNPSFQFVAIDTIDTQFLKYQFILSLNSTFTNLTFTASQLDDYSYFDNKPYFSSGETGFLELPHSLTPATTYYWSVSVTSDEGTTWRDAAAHYNFTTSAAPNERPVKPVFSAPLSGALNVSKIPRMDVIIADPEGDTLTCSIMLSTDPSLNNPKLFQSTYPGWDQSSYHPSGAYAGVTAQCQVQNSDSYQDALVPGTTYYIRATAIDHLEQSNSSDIISFTVVDRPLQPTVLTPLNNAIETSKTPSLQFSSTSATSSRLRYKLELSSNNFQTILVFSSEAGGGWTESSYSSGATAILNIPSDNALIPGVPYSWRVTAYDSDNDIWSVTSSASMFTVVTPPLTPDIISPDSQYEAPDSRITFRFTTESESGNTLNARLEISENQFQSLQYSFNQTENQNGWLEPYFYSNSQAAFTVPDSTQFDRNKTYFWRVAFNDGVSWGPYSESRTFSLTSSLTITRLKAYPNPAVRTNTFIIYTELSADSQIECKLFNKLGKEIDKKYFHASGGNQANTLALDISRFASGIYTYLLTIKSEFGEQKRTGRFAVVK